MSDPNQKMEQKLWWGSAGLYGIPWEQHRDYVQHLSEDVSHHPVRSGHGMLFGRPTRFISENLNKPHIRATRYTFPGGLEYNPCDFARVLNSSKKPTVDSRYIQGPVTTAPDKIWDGHL